LRAEQLKVVDKSVVKRTARRSKRRVCLGSVVVVRVDELLDEARATLSRLTPVEAWAALQSGAAIVDTRPTEQRVSTGVVPGSLLIDRKVLEWRLDPTSESRLPLASYDLHVVVLCQQGFSSSLAAASLQRLGVRLATDVVGGMEAWVESKLPTAPYEGPRRPL
jgi:rhodanese-related sulfurtransferase